MTTALLLRAGIEPAQPANEGEEAVYPFAVQLTFGKADPVFEHAERVDGSRRTEGNRTRPLPVITSLADSIPVQVIGTLVVHEDGSVGGRDIVVPLTAEYDLRSCPLTGSTRASIGTRNWRRTPSQWSVECPEDQTLSDDSGNALYIYRWDIPVVVTGTIDPGDHPEINRRVDLTLSVADGMLPAPGDRLTGVHTSGVAATGADGLHYQLQIGHWRLDRFLRPDQ